jgi:hypothetical protein
LRSTTLRVVGVRFWTRISASRPGNDAGPDGETLSEAKAAPYILNFKRVDTSNDRKISQEEWMAGCNKGWVSADARDVTPKYDPASGDSESNAMKSKDKDSMDHLDKSWYQ